MKRMILILGAIILAFGTFSCTKKGTGTSSKTIKLWHFWSEPSQKIVLQDLIKIFEQKYGCAVDATELSWGDGKTKLLAAFNSNTAPDVLELGSDWIAQFSSSGVLAELPADSINFNNCIEFSKAPAMWNSKIYACPWTVDTRVVFVNNALLQAAGYSKDAPPTTISKMMEMCEKIGAKGDIGGFGANGSDQHRLYKKILPFFWAYGGDIFDASGKPVINSDANVKGLEDYAKLSKTGIIESQRHLDAAFAQGKIGFWISGSWLIDKIARENPSLDYQIILMPGTENSKGISFAGGEYLAVSAKSEKKELAQKLIRFLTDGVNAVEFCKRINEAGFPADKNFYNDPVFAKNKGKQLFAKQLESSKTTPVHPKWLDIETLLENAVTEVLYGNKTAKQALDDAQFLTNQTIKNEN